MLIYEVLKIRDFRKLLRLLFATPQKLLRDPLWGRDPPVGNYWVNIILADFCGLLAIDTDKQTIIASQLVFKAISTYSFNFLVAVMCTYGLYFWGRRLILHINSCIAWWCGSTRLLLLDSDGQLRVESRFYWAFRPALPWLRWSGKKTHAKEVCRCLSSNHYWQWVCLNVAHLR